MANFPWDEVKSKKIDYSNILEKEEVEEYYKKLEASGHTVFKEFSLEEIEDINKHYVTEPVIITESMEELEKIGREFNDIP